MSRTATRSRGGALASAARRGRAFASAAVRRHGFAYAAVLLAAALLAPGCGGGEEEAADRDVVPSTDGVTAPAPSSTAPEREGSNTAPEREGKGTGSEPGGESTAPGTPEGGAGSPEDQPGGAGDEEPARSEVVLTGRGGRVGPPLVTVPPFLSIRVVLRSADGKAYTVRFGNRAVRAGAAGGASSASFDGLRPGRRLVGAAAAGRVVIEASAEPGP